MDERPPPEPNLDDARSHFRVVDPVFARATDGLQPIAAARPRDPYRALLRAIVGQQLSIRAAASIWRRVEQHFDGAPDPTALLAADDDALRSLGLSRQKASYCRNVAHAARDGLLRIDDLTVLDDAELVERLTTIKGVGRWTAEMIMMFGMRRQDVFSCGDLGLQQAMTAIYGFDETGRALRVRMRATAEPWSPHRTAACRLLWAWHRENLKPAGRSA